MSGVSLQASTAKRLNTIAWGRAAHPRKRWHGRQNAESVRQRGGIRVRCAATSLSYAFSVQDRICDASWGALRDPRLSCPTASQYRILACCPPLTQAGNISWPTLPASEQMLAASATKAVRRRSSVPVLLRGPLSGRESRRGHSSRPRERG